MPNQAPSSKLQLCGFHTENTSIAMLAVRI